MRQVYSRNTPLSRQYGATTNKGYLNSFELAITIYTIFTLKRRKYGFANTLFTEITDVPYLGYYSNPIRTLISSLTEFASL